MNSFCPNKNYLKISIINLNHETLLQTGIASEKSLLQKPIEFHM